MKTYSAKPDHIERQWWVVDAASAPLGRVASRVATLLRGKHKPMYTPHMDTGDHVIIVNCEQLQVTGSKMDQKVYDRYSGYHSGRRETTLRDRMEKNEAADVVRDAVKGMLPKNPLGRSMFSKLKVYAGSEHPHAAQNPQVLDLFQD